MPNSYAIGLEANTSGINALANIVQSRGTIIEANTSGINALSVALQYRADISEQNTSGINALSTALQVRANISEQNTSGINALTTIVQGIQTAAEYSTSGINALALNNQSRITQNTAYSSGINVLAINTQGNLLLTTKGDLLTHTGTAYARLPVGTNNQVLTADSTQISGLKWATPGAVGGLTAIGTAILDFGSPGEDGVVSLTVAYGSASTSNRYWATPDTTYNVDHDPEDYMLEAVQAHVANIVASTSYDVIGMCREATWGRYRFAIYETA